MNISYSTPVVNIRGETGYGYAGRSIVNSLNLLGHFVPFQDPKSPVQLNFSQPDLFKLHRGQYQIGYTPWESTVVPKRWHDMMNHCDELWTTSDWCANVFEDNGFKNVKVFPHGIDSMWTSKKRERKETLKFLHIGEPAPRKGGQMVVDAFSYLFGNKPEYSLTIKCFNQNTTRVYNNYIDKNIIGVPNELYSNIHINDKVLKDQELVRLYHEHDVLVYPSYGEGFGFIPLQALATGMPTISTYDWAQYRDYIGPLKLNSEVIDSPWDYMHEGKVFEPKYQHLLELMRDIDLNFKAYSAYYYTQSTKIHEEYNWLQLTNNAFDHIFKKFS